MGLISGGLDSILAARIILAQRIEVIGLAFTTPFFGSLGAEQAAQAAGIPLRIVDITELHLATVKSPRHGYGSNMNPCIDCHALMLRQAGKVMEREGGDFLFTGEVLGQRPMSQNKTALRTVERESGYEGATRITKELLAEWNRTDRFRRLFFCQREAAETIIYLAEIRTGPHSATA
jgi:tRNA U34 2-thiouridine synthase MnmA/TrmU